MGILYLQELFLKEHTSNTYKEHAPRGNWHTHAEIPKPIPAGSKFWAEVEPATGDKFKVSFDFKAK